MSCTGFGLGAGGKAQFANLCFSQQGVTRGFWAGDTWLGLCFSEEALFADITISLPLLYLESDNNPYCLCHTLQFTKHFKSHVILTKNVGKHCFSFKEESHPAELDGLS